MSGTPPEPVQPSLLGDIFAPVTTPKPEWVGVARVAIDSPLPHLDRLFDYGIPAPLDASARPGVRVRVRFAGVDRDGVIIERQPTSAHADLQPLRRVIGEVDVLTGEIRELCHDIAERYAGGLSDVLRLALPPRHATTEKSVLAQDDPPATTAPDPDSLAHVGAWDAYPAGAAFLRRLAAGESPRAIWAALPGPAGTGLQDWARAIVAACAATLSSGRGVVVVAPTAEDVAAVAAAFEAAGVAFVELTAEQGTAQRYENFLACRLGRVQVAVGSRAAAWAPIENLGLVVVWDEAHDTLAEPRAPYPHAREVLVRRAELTDAAALIGGFARTPEAQHLAESGWAHDLSAHRAAVRERTPRIVVPDEFDLDREGALGHARIPQLAWRRITAALETGPVLLQVPRAGYLPGLACARCRETARCTHCHGPLGIRDGQGQSATCEWCGKVARDWECPHCEHTAWRARAIGSERTAEELGRAFPGVPVRVSGRAAARIDVVRPTPQLIISTPGAEPVADGGYGLAVLLDADSLTARPYLVAQGQAIHRWLRAASLVRPSGEVLILGQPMPAPAQAVIRWDAAGFARRELAEWTTLGFPPATTVVAITGAKEDVAALGKYLPEVPTLTQLGPVVVPSARLAVGGDDDLGLDLDAVPVRLLLRADAAHHLELTTGVRAAVRIKSARRDGRPVNVRVNPTDLL